MEQERKERMDLRGYLLGKLTDEEQLRQIEEQIFLDNDFFDDLSMAEENLKDEYLNGELDEEDKQRFVQHFLSAPERQKELRFDHTLRAYAADSARHEKKTQSLEGRDSEPVNFFSWKRMFSSQPIKIAAVLLIALGIGFGVWRVFFYQSDVERGLVQLRIAYHGLRPIQARTTAGFDYAPQPDARGNNKSMVDATARDRAARLLLDATQDNSDPAAHHALGLYYLADKQLEKALNEFEVALKLSPNDARLYSDIGAALLERAKQDGMNGRRDKNMEDLARSLERLSKALALDGTLLEALFNRALCLQEMTLTNQTKEAWQKYLEKDATSQWANEARQNLGSLEGTGTTTFSPDQVLREFLGACNLRDDQRAWQLYSQTREIITGMMLPFQLAEKFLESDLSGKESEADKYLSAFKYIGELEVKNSKDSYFRELADYYSKTDRKQRLTLLEARKLLVQAYSSCLKGKYAEALDLMGRTKRLFALAENTWEAKLCDYWLGYCLLWVGNVDESVTTLNTLLDYCEKRNYLWLQAQTLYRLANNYVTLNDPSKVIRYSYQALNLADAISDTYNAQKILLELGVAYRMIGRFDKALEFHQKSLAAGETSRYFPRQRWRNLTIVTQTLFAQELFSAAYAFEREALYLAAELKSHDMVHRSYIRLSQIEAKTGEYEKALQELDSSLEALDKIKDDSSSKRLLADSTLHRAHLYRLSGNCPKAIGLYDQALDQYSASSIDLEKYNARKGRLRCYISQGNDELAQKELAQVLELFEQYRARILEEQNRNSFFDTEQDVYDLAIEYERSRGNIQKSFDYAENYRARSLLDSSVGELTISNTGPDHEANISDVAKPMSLTEIRDRLPDQTQLVEYTVLENRLLVWVVTKSKFELIERNVSRNDLKDLVSEYLTEIRNPNLDNPEKEKRLASRLYEVLILPIEHLLDKSREVSIIPDEFLFDVPYAALMSPQSGERLIESFTLLIAPSANVLIAKSETAKQRAAFTNESLLSVGNPEFDRKEYPDLSDLPAAQTEAQRIASLYANSMALIGAKARKKSVASDIEKANIFHFAGHYVVDSYSPMKSKLLLTREREANDKGELSIQEIYTKDLKHSKLMVLAACQTGIESYLASEGLIGLARAFLIKGVPLVVGSQWAVDSEATSNLMIAFHTYRKERGMATTAALRRAQLDMMKSSTVAHRHPFYWAAFFAIGGHADY